MNHTVKVPDDIKLPAGYSVLKPIPTLSIEPGDSAIFELGAQQAEYGFRAIILDFEATSVDADEATPIELAMVECLIDSSGNVLQVTNVFQAFNDPGFPLSDEVIEVTGITDDMLAGQLFDHAEIQNFIVGDGSSRPVMVAHNICYDKKVFERLMPELELPWGCTLSDIEWEGLRCSSKQQINLLRESGYDFDAHRALADTMALTWLLALYPDKMKAVFQKALQPTYTIYAKSFPFDAKDYIKLEHKYQWLNKEWTKLNVRGEDELSAQLHMLEGHYDNHGHHNKAEFVQTSPAFKVSAVPVPRVRQMQTQSTQQESNQPHNGLSVTF